MKKPISFKQNRYFNGENVDSTDLSLEQSYNNSVQSAIISNHVGSGVLSDNLSQPVLYDSSLSTGLLDGKPIDVQAQPSDNNLGNQLEVTLSKSAVAGKRVIKICLIGLDFNGDLQYERFIFHKNEKQVSQKHYTKVLKVLFNDFVGDPNQSLNLGGRVTIKEARSLYLSRSCVMVSQDVEPNVFFRDFYVATAGSLSNLLTAALPSYNTDVLDISMSYKQLRSILPNDVSSQIGQKFLATTNNIQKISLLLSVINNVTPSDLQWTGELIVNLYQLQSTIDNPLDIVPNTAIDFDPYNIPIAQLSFNYNDLLARGVKLGETPQPVDFVFSNTPVGTGGLIKPGSYYAITVKRGGASDKCSIQLAIGSNRTPDSHCTLFNGSIWVDVVDDDLWFQVYTDAAKVTDGQAYDDGQGVMVAKTAINELTGAPEDYCLDKIPFVRNDIYYGLLEADTEESGLVQDQRTGESVQSQQQLIPSVSLITSSELNTAQSAQNPLLIGTIADKNSKAISVGSTTLSSKFHSFGLIKNQAVIKVIDDPTDARYDLSIINLISELTGSSGVSNINGILNCQFTPDVSNPSVFYRIANTELITMVYGDLNGDGVVDDTDLQLMSDYVGIDMNSIPSSSDYLSLTTLFKTDNNLTWQLLGTDKTTIVASGTNASLTVNPQDGTIANFGNPTIGAAVVGGYVRIYNNTTNPGNNGTYLITAKINSTNVTIKKNFYSSDSILTALRADINGDMKVDSGDSLLVSNYVNKAAPFPANTSPGNRVGTVFSAIRLTFEPYVDRADDYLSSGLRGTALHPIPDVLIDESTAGNSKFGSNLLTSPISFSINKQLNWYDYLVSSTSNPKLVPSSFNYQTGHVEKTPPLSGVTNSNYPLKPLFDPGRNDSFFPDNVVINNGGELLRPDGNNYSVDFETGTFLLEIPAGSFLGEKNINVFTDLVANYTGTGTTRLGYPAMRYADTSFVSLSDLAMNRVRFSVALNSFSPEINGMSILDTTQTGIIVDGGIGVAFNSTTGILTLNFNNLYEDPVLQTMKTRMQIVVFLKKAGFNNAPITVSSVKVKNLLGL